MATTRVSVEVTVREAREDDCEGIATLIQELADYEKMPTGPKIGAETLRKDGFGPEKMFRCFVADDNANLVGYALYFFNYSTWEGVNVYLEDLYVTPSHRQQGVGVRLWKAVAKVAVERNCNRLDWVVLGWNKSSVEFYEAKGAVNLTQDEDWNLFRLTGDNLKAFALSC
ncbi:thialysine N-epsilon-acetyltransferase-like [Mya arenaria]|nr:thialysine N-epsilon-acetyltransferase-like [Mya arenaria]